MQLFQKAKVFDRIKGISSFSMPYSTGRPLGAFSGDCCDRSAVGGLRSETCGDFTSPLCGEIRLAGSPGMGCCEVCRGASTRCRGGCGDAGAGSAACSCRCRGTGRVVDGPASGLRDGRAESSGFDGSAACSCRCRCCTGRLVGGAASGLRVGRADNSGFGGAGCLARSAVERSTLLGPNAGRGRVAAASRD